MSGSALSARPLSPISWICAPMLLALVATLLLGAPLRLFGLALPEPVFPMALAFAWAVIRPSILGPLAVLVLGLLLDLYWGGPGGLWAVSLLIAYAAVLLGRHLLVGRGTASLAICYGLASAAGFAVACLIVLLRSRVLPDMPAVGLQLAVTVALFPLAHWLIRRFEDTDVRFR